jgi:hypothetical protein
MKKYLPFIVAAVAAFAAFKFGLFDAIKAKFAKK